MRLAIQRLQRPLEVVERCPGKADYLVSIVDGVHTANPRGIEDDNGTSVIAMGSRPAGQTRIGSLWNDDDLGCNAPLRALPQLDETSGSDHRECCSRTKAEAGRVTRNLFPARQDMSWPDDHPQSTHELVRRQPGTPAGRLKLS